MLSRQGETALFYQGGEATSPCPMGSGEYGDSRTDVFVPGLSVLLLPYQGPDLVGL